MLPRRVSPQTMGAILRQTFPCDLCSCVFTAFGSKV
jgi:hypothetical protein